MKAAAILARVLLCLALVAGGGAFAFAQSEEDKAEIAELKQKAEQGNMYAQWALGSIYHDGRRGVAQNFTEAVKWFRLSAEQGHSTAQTLLGLAYLRGNGVLPNYKEAVRQLRLAAEQDGFVAQMQLAEMYFEGYGVTQDYSEAYIWYALSALNGGSFKDMLVERRQMAEEKLTTDELNQAQAEAAKRLEEIKKKRKAAAQ